MTTYRLFPLLVAFAALLLQAAPASAQVWGGGDPRTWRQGEGQYEAYNRGYRKGLDQGGDDAKDRRVFDYRRDNDYRKADDGYKDRYGSRVYYQNEFRRGFVAGYTRGYNDYARRYDNRGYRNDGYGNNGGTYGRAYPGGGQYGAGQYYARAGYSRGHADGVVKGAEDARRNRSFEPTRHGWYRSADRGYDRDYGPRPGYEASYRDGFRTGYAEGYRSGGRYNRW